MDVLSAKRLRIDQRHPNCMYHRQRPILFSLNNATGQLHHSIRPQIRCIFYCFVLATIVLHGQLAGFDSMTAIVDHRSWLRRVNLAIRYPIDQRLVHIPHYHTYFLK